MPHFARFTAVVFKSDRCGVGSPFSHINHRHELADHIRLVNMDQVKMITAGSVPKIGIQTTSLYMDSDYESEKGVILVATQEIEAWLADNPQFGGRSTLHLMDQEKHA